MGEVVEIIKDNKNTKKVFVYSSFNEESLQLKLYSKGIVHRKRVYLVINIAEENEKVSVSSMDYWLNEIVLPDEKELAPLFFEEVYLLQTFEKSFLVFILGTDMLEAIDLRSIREVGHQILISWTQRPLHIPAVETEKESENNKLLMEILEELIQLNIQEDVQELKTLSQENSKQIDALIETSKLREATDKTEVIVEITTDQLQQPQTVEVLEEVSQEVGAATQLMTEETSVEEEERPQPRETSLSVLPDIDATIKKTKIDLEAAETVKGYSFISKREVYRIIRKIDVLPYFLMELKSQSDEIWQETVEELEKLNELALDFVESLDRLPSLPLNSKKIISKSQIQKVTIYQRLASELETSLYTRISNE